MRPDDSQHAALARERPTTSHLSVWQRPTRARKVCSRGASTCSREAHALTTRNTREIPPRRRRCSEPVRLPWSRSTHARGYPLTVKTATRAPVSRAASCSVVRCQCHCPNGEVNIGLGRRRQRLQQRLESLEI